MANKVSFIIDLKDRFSREANKIRTSTRGVTTKLDKLKRKLRQAGDGLARFGRKARSAGKSMVAFGGKLVAGLTVPFAAFGLFALKQSAKLETLRVSFETMTGSVAKGKKLFESITKFTATTPFKLEGVGQATRKLLSFQVSIEDMTPTLRQLGDIASGIDAPIADIAAIFGKAKAKTKLMTEEIFQLSDRGIPIIKILAETMNVAEKEIFNLASKSKISFGLMEKAFDKMTSEGGVFFESTIKQSRTLAGRWSTLADNINLVSGAFGDIIVRETSLKQVLATISEFLDELKNKIKAFGEEQPEIAAMIVAFAGIVTVLGPVVVVVGALIFALSLIAGAASAVIVPLLAFVLAMTAIIGLAPQADLIFAAFDRGVEIMVKLKNSAVDMFSTAMASMGEFKDSVISSFSAMIDPIMAFGKAIFDFALKPIGAVIANFASLKNLASKFIFGDVNTTQPVDINQHHGSTSRSQTDIMVHLRAPENVVESTKIKSTGDRKNLNVGMNMIPEGA